MATKILVLEDESIIRADLCSIIERSFEDITVAEARGLDDALEVTNNSEVKIALVDVKLGNNMHGFSYADALRKKYPKSKVIFVTSYTDDDNVNSMVRLNADAIVTKPYTSTQIKTAVNSCLKTIEFDHEALLTKPQNGTLKADYISQKLQLEFYERSLNQIALVSITDKDGNIVLANNKFCQISGYSESELIGKNHRIIKSKEHSTGFWKEMYDTVNAGKVWSGEVKNTRKDGSFYWVKSFVCGFFDDSGNLANYFSIRFDITKEKETRKHYKLKNEYFNNLFSEKYLQSFMSGVFHHINNIVLPTPYITKKLKSNVDSKNYDGVVEEAVKLEARCERLKTFIEDLRNISDTVSSQEDNQNQPIECGKLFKVVLDTLKTLDVNIAALSFAEFVGDKKSLVSVNLREIQEVFTELLQNSQDFNPGKNDLAFELEFIVLDDALVMTYKDNGRGFDEKTLSKVGLPYFSTKSEVYNTGIGLSRIRHIVRKHHGYVFFENNHGAKTTIELPTS